MHVCAKELSASSQRLRIFHQQERRITGRNMHSNNLLLKNKTPPQLYTSLQLLSAINVGLNRLTALQPQELLTLLFRLKQIQRIAAPATATVFLP